MDSDKLRQIQGFYQFGAFRMDAAERRLWCENEMISLTPKQFELLFYFVENAGRVAKKDELLEAVWADTYVEESTLARNVSWLRKKLSEHTDDEQFIETVPKFGYRFTAEVTRFAEDENVLIIEEQTVQHFRGEEIITIDNENLRMRRHGDAAMQRLGDEENKLSISPNSAASSPFLLIALALAALAGIGFVVYQQYFKPNHTKAVVASRVVPFSGAQGYENTPAFSPDGKQLAYSWNGGEGSENDIYIKLVGAGEPLRLTETKANEQYPTFSPDGSHIAFVRGKYGEPGEVILIPSLGGTERRVARLFSGNYSISYSPDGKNIAVIDTENSTESGQFAVYLINIEIGDRRRVTAPADFVGENTPRFSPDGQSLAFIRVAEEATVRSNGKQDLFVVTTEGGEPRQITFDGVIINSLAWSADGEDIYFVPTYPPNQTIVRRIPVGGGEQTIVSTGSQNITNIALSPDGKTLVFAEDLRHWSILRVTANGETGKRLIDSNVNELFPKFSPDGSRIAFQTDRTGISQIWMADADGKNLRQIAETPFPSQSPQFSPDGSRIAFNQNEGEYYGNYTVAAQGGVPQRISQKGVRDDFPTWSADGRYIYFTSNRSGEPKIWKTPADGAGEAVQITESNAYRATPAPDGTTVYFAKIESANEMWRVPADGGAEEIVPEFAVNGFFGNWEMTETGIYFLASGSDRNIKLKFYDFADRQIKDAPGDYKIPSNLDVNFITTDGKVLLCSVVEKASRLMLANLP